MSWQNALVDYAKTKDPSKLPSKVYLTHTEHTLTIWDKFPKAMFHFLCLPRLPFIEPASKAEISGSTLDALSALISSKHALKVLRILQEASQEVVETIEEEMLKKEGFVWPVSVGFHPIESMSHVHLHIISREFASDALKNKKHWNSFNPDHGFFLHLDKLIEWLEAGTLAKNNKSKSTYNQLLKDPLKCYKCDETFNTIPKLKEHLEADFKKLKAEGLKKDGSAAAGRGQKRSHSEEEVDAKQASEDEVHGEIEPDAKKLKP